jgi:hypothetical protein
MQNGIQGRRPVRRDHQAPCPARCLKKPEPRNTLIVWKLDRLGRSLRDLITMLEAPVGASFDQT